MRELTEKLKKELTNACYPDEKFKTLTVDIGYYFYTKSKEKGTVNYWWLNANPEYWSYEKAAQQKSGKQFDRIDRKSTRLNSSH